MSNYDIGNRQSNRDLIYGNITVLVIIINFCIVGVI